MINQSLIDTGSAHLIGSIRSAKATVYDGLYTLDSIIDEQSLISLKSYIDSESDGKWKPLPRQELKVRHHISWDSCTIIEELNEMFKNATPVINELFPDVEKSFWGVAVWKDAPGYQIGWHTDNPDIDVAMQVYLYTEPGLGTVFGSESHPVLISSMHNSGYLMCNSADRGVPHKTENIVPDNTVRYSLYAVWSRLPKHVTDT